jgi:iron complex outermembrane receptor protein
MSSVWSIGANAGSAWRPPSVNELYSNGVHHGTAQYEIGNPLLSRERSYSLDATVKHFGEHSRGEVSTYQTWFTGFISLLPEAQPTLTLRGLFPTFRYMQSDAVLRGVEAMVEQEFLRVFSAGVSLSIVRGEQRSNGDPLYQMPADRVRSWLHVHLPDVGILEDPDVQLGVQAVAKQTRVPASGDYLAAPSGYLLVDAECGAALIVSGTRVRVNASVRNLFNVSYRDYLSRFRYFVDDPGRNVVLRLQIPFGSTN